jgi:cobalamin-dependent methionine synthase I
MLKTSNAVFDIGSDVSLMLKSVEKIAVFACTVSSELNEVLENEKNSADLLQSYLLDIIGTVIAGKIADVLHQNITQKFSNVNVTNTISPGNCGWPVEDQKKLFSLLPPGFLNISLNPSGMMYPVKSLTGMIGIGTKVKFKQTECRYCRSRNCPYRKEEYAG